MDSSRNTASRYHFRFRKLLLHLNTFLAGDHFPGHSDVWIGLNGLEAPGKWIWTDGSLYDFTELHETQSVNCVFLALKNGLWATDNCYVSKPYICMTKDFDATPVPTIPPTCTGGVCPPPLTCCCSTPPCAQCPPPTCFNPPCSPYTCPTPAITTCSPGYSYFENACYRYIQNTDKSWNSALTDCESQNANLASIHTRDEAGFVSGKFLLEPPSLRVPVSQFFKEHRDGARSGF